MFSGHVPRRREPVCVRGDDRVAVQLRPVQTATRGPRVGAGLLQGRRAAGTVRVSQPYRGNSTEGVLYLEAAK